MKRLCSIDIDGRSFEYLLDISNRKGGYICIKEQQLVVRLPIGAKQSDAEKLLLSHKEWVFKKLECSADKSRLPDKAAEGVEFPLLGRKRRLHFAVSAEYKSPLLEDDSLTVFVSESMSAADAERLFWKYISGLCEKQVRDAFDRFVPVLKLSPKKVTIKSMTSRWGSCSSNRNISISAGVICFEQECIDYVVVHELCHIKHMNHGEDFWKLVSTCCPDYKVLRERMKH